MHYDDVWEDEHEIQFKIERNAAENRKQLLDTLSTEEMVKIMFKYYLHKLSNSEVDKLKEEYIHNKEQNTN